MLKLCRRFKSSLVKAEASASLNNVIEEGKQYYELADYQTGNLKRYFEQDGLSIPVETIIEKSRDQDFDFFLNRGNFMKVADTLEKFGANLDMEHKEAKDFILFKKKLYKLYEVRARSSLEHAQFSTEIREEELTHVYSAHKHHLHAISNENAIKRYLAQKQLKGGFYKRKLLSPSRLKGLSGTALAFTMYMYNPYIAAYFASSYLLAKTYSVAPIAAALYGFYHLSESNIVHAISRVDGGSDDGKIKITIAKSPIMNKDIIAEAHDVLYGGQVANTNVSALRILRGHDLETGEEFDTERVYTFENEGSGNAWIDSEGMNWIFQKKASDSSTDGLFGKLVHHRAKQIASSKRESKDLLQEIKFVVEH